jgi:hypothetical protein
MIKEEKKTFSRRKLIGGMGKLSYIVPTLTILTLGTSNTHAVSVPCPPNDPCDSTAGAKSSKQESRVKSRKKQREE